jgi:hypothetical protein
MARVMEDYAMQQDDELTLHKGGIVMLYEKDGDDWFVGEINGKHGRFPAKVCVIKATGFEIDYFCHSQIV